LVDSMATLIKKRVGVRESRNILELLTIGDLVTAEVYIDNGDNKTGYFTDLSQSSLFVNLGIVESLSPLRIRYVDGTLVQVSPPYKGIKKVQVNFGQNVLTLSKGQLRLFMKEQG